TAIRPTLADDDRAMGLRDRAQDRLFIEGAKGPQVDDLDVDALLRELLGRLERDVDHARPGNDGAVLAGTDDVRDTERDEVLAVRNLALEAVERLAFEKEHRIVVTNARLQKTERIGRRGGGDAFEAGNVHVEVLHRVRMLGADLPRRGVGGAEDDGHRELPARHLSNLRRAVENLVEGNGGEVPGHKLDDRPQPDHRGTDAGARESRFGDGR